MAKKLFITGNEAIGEAAIRAGCTAYYGYPITPQNELTAYMAKYMPKLNRIFIQTESEICAINAVYGSSAAGARSMTSSSSTAMSLKQEGISHIAYMEIPCVIVDVMRGGPGLGNIMATQGDYNQAVKGGGTGDYHVITFAPNSVQEAADLTKLAFELSDKYRNPAMVLSDGIIGQMMELVEFDEPIDLKDLPERKWSLTGCKGREPNVIGPYNSTEDLENHNLCLQHKYAEIEKNEKRFETYLCEDADYLLTAFGSYSRITKEIVNKLREESVKIGFFRPISLYPFPDDALLKTVQGKKAIIDLEGNAGMMAKDILLYSRYLLPLFFHGRMGGSIIEIDDVLLNIKKLIKSNLKEWGSEEFNGKWETL